MPERRRALPLRGKIDDDLRPLTIEDLHQEIEFVIYMIGVIAISGIAIADAQCEAFVFWQIAADRDDFGGIGVFEQALRGMKPKRSAPTPHSLAPPPPPRSSLCSPPRPPLPTLPS